MKYPQGKHFIQVLDDSTDETSEVIAAKKTRIKKKACSSREKDNVVAIKVSK